MSVIIRLQGLPWSASAMNIRHFFSGLNIPAGGVHIIGGDGGDAFIAFSSDDDARMAMKKNMCPLNGTPVQLFLSSKAEMQSVIDAARSGTTATTGSASLAMGAGGQSNIPEQRGQQFSNMYAVDNQNNNANVAHQNSGFSTDLANQWQNYQMYGNRTDGQGTSQFNVSNQRSSAEDGFFLGIQNVNDQRNQFGAVQQPMKVAGEGSTPFLDTKQLQQNILNTIGLGSMPKQTPVDVQGQLGDKHNLFNESSAAPVAKPADNLALINNILSKGQSNFPDLMASGMNRGFVTIPGQLNPGISNDKIPKDPVKSQLPAEKFLGQYGDENKLMFVKDDRSKEVSQWPNINKLPFEQDNKNENSSVGRDKFMTPENRLFDPFLPRGPSTERMNRGPEIALEQGMAAPDMSFSSRMGGRFPMDTEQSSRIAERPSERYNENVRPAPEDSMPSTRYPPDDEADLSVMEPRQGRFPPLRGRPDERFSNDERHFPPQQGDQRFPPEEVRLQNKGPGFTEGFPEGGRNFPPRGFDNQFPSDSQRFGPESRRFPPGFDGRFPPEETRFPPDNRFGMMQDQEGFLGRRPGDNPFPPDDIRFKEREEELRKRAAFEMSRRPDERFMHEGQRLNMEYDEQNEGQFVPPDRRFGPDRGLQGDRDAREFRDSMENRRERISRWDRFEEGDRNFQRPGGPRAPLLENPDMPGPRQFERPPPDMNSEEPMDMDQRAGRGMDETKGTTFEERRMGIGGRGGPGFDGRPGPGFDGRPGPGFEGRTGPGFDGRPGPGFDGRPGPGFDGRHGPGFEARPGPGFDGRPGQGFEGRPGPGFEGRHGPGFEGRHGTGFDGRPGPGFEGRMGPGVDGRQGQGFEGRPSGPGFEGARDNIKEGFRGPGMDGVRGRGFEGMRGRGFEGRGRGGPGIEASTRPGVNDENRFEYGHNSLSHNPSTNEDEFGLRDFDNRFQGPPGRGNFFERRGRGDPFMRGRPGPYGRGRGFDVDRRFEDSGPDGRTDIDARNTVRPDGPPVKPVPVDKVQDTAGKSVGGKGLLGDAPSAAKDNAATEKKDAEPAKRDYDHRARRSYDRERDRRSSDRRDRDREDRRFDDSYRSRYRYERDRRRSRSRDRGSRDKDSRRSRDRSASTRDHDSRGSPRRQERSRCILMKNFPNTITYKEVRRFLHPMEIPYDGLKLINDEKGQRTGEVYVQFRRGDDQPRALRRSGERYGGQIISISHCTEAEFAKAIDSYYNKDAINVSEKSSNSANKAVDSDKVRYIVQLQNLPQSITKQDIVQFFKGLSIENNGEACFIEFDTTGVATGNGFVEFKSDYDYKKALTQDGSVLGTTTVRVFPGKKEEADDLKNKQQEMFQRAAIRNLTGGKIPQPLMQQQISRPGLMGPRAPASTPANNQPINKPSPSNIQMTNRPSTPSSDPSPAIDTVCVHIQGLPLLATTQDIREFFSDCQIALRGINIAHDGKGKPLGEGFVEFKFKSDFEKGIKKDKTSFGRHIVAVKPISKKDMIERLENARQRGLSPSKATTMTNEDPKKTPELTTQQPAQSNIPPKPLIPPLISVQVAKPVGQTPPASVTPNTSAAAPAVNKPVPQGVTVTAGGSKSIPPGVLNKNWFYVRCQNFPPDISIQEILHFFQNFSPIGDSIRLHYSNEGKPTGNAVVGFASAEEAKKALQCLNSKPCRQNIVSLHPA